MRRRISFSKPAYMLMSEIHAFYISNAFITDTRLKLAKNQANANPHPEAELLLFENYSLSSSMLSSKTNMRYSKKRAKNKCVLFNEIKIIIMKMKVKMKNRSHKYNRNRSSLRHGYEYTTYKMCLTMMVICNKQHLSHI